MHDEYSRGLEPQRQNEVGRVMQNAARGVVLALGLILTILGLYFLVDTYSLVANFVESPVRLEPVLSAWESNLASDVAPTPLLSAPYTSASSIGRFFNDLVRQLSNGQLARPIGAFFVFIFVLVLVKIALGVFSAGVRILLAVINPQVKKTLADDEEQASQRLPQH